MIQNWTVFLIILHTYWSFEKDIDGSLRGQSTNWFKTITYLRIYFDFLSTEYLLYYNDNNNNSSISFSSYILLDKNIISRQTISSTSEQIAQISLTRGKICHRKSVAFFNFGTVEFYDFTNDLKNRCGWGWKRFQVLQIIVISWIANYFSCNFVTGPKEVLYNVTVHIRLDRTSMIL